MATRAGKSHLLLLNAEKMEAKENKELNANLFLLSSAANKSSLVLPVGLVLL